MKMTACISLLFATLAWADEAADRSAIERVIGVLNDCQAGSSKKRTLFTSDADSELEHPSKLDRRLLQLSSEPWSEVTALRLVIHSIRFVTNDVALVDAASTQYGSTILVRRISSAIGDEKGRNRLADSVSSGAGACDELAF